MDIKCFIPDVDEMMAVAVDQMEQAVIYRFAEIGEKCVTEARKKHDYTDRTGNLTSSIGYVIAVDGQVIRQSSFEKVKKGDDGVKAGPGLASEIVKQTPKGIALIVVAGMNYARYVADRGKNVLQSAELLQEKLVDRLVKQLGFRRW